MIGHEDGRWTQVIYFTSEAEAREGERKEPPPEWQATMEELTKLSVGETGLHRPAETGPAVPAVS